MSAINRTKDGSDEPGDAWGAACGEADVASCAELSEPGTGVVAHGSFNAFAPSAAAGFPPAVKAPLTVITWGIGSDQANTENVRPSKVVAEAEAPEVDDFTSPSTLRVTEARDRDWPKV